MARGRIESGGLRRPTGSPRTRLIHAAKPVSPLAASQRFLSSGADYTFTFHPPPSNVPSSA